MRFIDICVCNLSKYFSRCTEMFIYVSDKE